MNDHAASDREPARREIYDLADRLLCDGLSDAELDRLERLLCDDADARRHYVRFMHHSAKLCRLSSAMMGAGAAEASGARGQGPGAGAEGSGFGVQGSGSERPLFRNSSFGTPMENNAAADSPPPFPLPSSPFSLASFLHFSPLAAAPLCYAVAVLIVGVGILAAGLWETPGNRPTATIGRAIPQPARQSAPREVRRQRQSVGKITWMSGSRWRDEKIAEEAKEVPVGGEYLLGSGVLEITYNTGAKVTLEGRTRYIVDSPNSGSLLVGKLTVKTNAKAKDGKPKFAIRTPTTAITERGAEFGVWVSQSKVTYTTVIRGNIECRLLGEGTKILSFGKGDWACVTLRADFGRDVIYGKAGDKPPALLADQLHETMPIFSSDKVRDGQQQNSPPESENKEPRQSGSPDS